MTTLVTKRPDTTLGSVGITLFGGAGTLHATLADTNNATYAQCAPAGLGKILFDGLSIPSGAVVQSIVLRITARRVANGTVLNASLNGHSVTQFHPPTGSGWATLSSTSFAGVLSNADLAAGVSMLWAVGPGNADISEAFLDITYIPLPTLNVTAPTGTITVSQPTITWDYTGDYPQERFRIKIFNSAQYTGVGFNVETSSPVYDSGEQLGSTNTFVPTVNLLNADTYRVYVKVAQRVGSTTQWSAWDFTQPAVLVTPAPVPVLTLEADGNQGRIKITATDTGTPSWQLVTIQRTTDGTNWTPVRSANRALVSGTTFVVYDYETGNHQNAQYAAQSIIADPAGDIASAWSPPTSPVFWSSPLTWLKSVTQPTLNRTVLINELPTVKRRIPRGVMDVAGRRDPIIVTDTRKLIEGSVTVLTLTDDDRDGIDALLDISETLLLQTPEEDGFGSRYISCGDTDENRTSRRSHEPSRLVVIPFNEVTAPVGEVVTFGSSWDDLVARYADWDAVLANFPTWASVVAAHL